MSQMTFAFVCESDPILFSRNNKIINSIEMEDICRLCCSSKFVNNCIFDEENALYLKMSLYLPIKVFKNDRLPQKICDKCSCKVNDFYQFCNEAIEVQNRLRATYLMFDQKPLDTEDLTQIKDDVSLPPVTARCDQDTQTEDIQHPAPAPAHTPNSALTEDIKIKEEPNCQNVVVKTEHIDSDDQDDLYKPSLNMHSDSSEDVSLLTLKKKKRAKKPVDKNNGATKKGRKKEPKVNPAEKLNDIKLEVKNDYSSDDDFNNDFLNREFGLIKNKLKKDTTDKDIFHCCVCFAQCHSRSEMLKHYKAHSSAIKLDDPPSAPPPPESLRCSRCQKTVTASEWGAHWRGHWARDRRPLRCALCARTFRDHKQILRHSLTHKFGEEGPEKVEQPQKLYLCDLCPERFSYMKCLLAHRTVCHPAASARAPALRCGECSRTFAHLNSLRRHVAAHSGARDFLCNVCGKALSSREHLKLHIRIHTGHKPHVCRDCGKGFVKRCNLKLHERVHSGEKPHVCAACGKAFSQRSTLVIHERYHSGARPYACRLCGRGFVAQGLLTMHLKTTCI